MTDPTPKKPADLRDEAGDDDDLFRQLMSDYGWMTPVGHPDRQRRRELRIERGYLLPDP